MRLKVSVLGHFGKGRNLLNGQTIKTKIVSEELQKQLEFYKEKVQHLTEELNIANSSTYKYKRLFSQLFDRLQVTGVSRYKVVKDMNNINDVKTLFCIEYNDGNSYVYDVKLVSTGYREDLNGNVQADETR